MATRLGFFALTFSIKSPSGIKHKIQAESIYHAVQIAIRIDKWKYSASDFFKLNHKI